MGFVLGPLLLGWIIDVTDSFSWALIFNAVLLGGAAIVFGLFARETVMKRTIGGAHEPQTDAGA
jgi:hypothetical protein